MALIVIHFPQTVKEYAEAEICPGRTVSVPECCPTCQVEGEMIRWGRYKRSVKTGEAKYELQIQRVRCQACGRSQALLPDFLHPYRHYLLSLLQKAIWLYLFVGLGIERLIERLPPAGPEPSTVQEWVRSFGYGAGYLLLDVLRRFVMSLYAESDLSGRAPLELERSGNAEQLKKSYHFWRWGEILYARQKEVEPHMSFSDAQFFPFLVRWLQSQSIVPRIFWSPRLARTPTAPFTP
jgi:transposase-like protein